MTDIVMANLIGKLEAEVERLRAALHDILADPCVTDQMAAIAKAALTPPKGEDK